MASPITFTGLASGIDSDAIVSALTGAAKAPINKLNTQKTAFASQSRKLTDIKTKLTALQTAAKALNNKSDALGNKATSTDEKLVKVTSTGGAAIGNSKIEVKNLATAQRNYSEPLASNTELGAAGVGTLTIKVGDADAVNVDITADDNLQGIASKINASGAAVSAGIIKEGNNYRLQVTAKQSGAANAVTFTEDGSLGLGLDTSTGIPPAKDALVVVDGFSVTSATNEITSAVPGATLTLVGEGTATVQLERNPEDLKTKLNAFVTAYNDVMKTLNSEFAGGSGTTPKGADSLGNDSAMRSLQSALRQAVTSVTGNGSSTLTTLASVGIKSARDGTLSLDESKFKSAVASDYEGMATALAGLTDGSGLMSKISKAVDPFSTTGGVISSKIDTLQTRSKRIDDQVASMQMRLDKYESTLRAQYSSLEATIGKLQSQGTSLGSIISSM